MERLKAVVTKIAYTDARKLLRLPPLCLSFLPLLSFASSLYGIGLFVRRSLYSAGFFKAKRLSVPVISVGNITWGGNGKTPMVEHIALKLHKAGILPLILTRGYAGGDEARMLREHFCKTPVKVVEGADRAGVAACFIQKMDRSSAEGTVGAVILDDGMQYWSLHRDLEIVMVNGLAAWGNKCLLPLGPLREPLSALKRANLAFIHHADMLPDKQILAIKSTISAVKKDIPIFYSRLKPSCFFEVKNPSCKLPLRVAHNIVVLCVSAIGFPESFVRVVRKIGPLHIDRLDFSDHHHFLDEDFKSIDKKLMELNEKFGLKAVVVLTEKDYHRDPVILRLLDAHKVLVLCSSLEILPCGNRTEDGLEELLQRKLGIRYEKVLRKIHVEFKLEMIRTMLELVEPECCQPIKKFSCMPPAAHQRKFQKS